MSDTTIIGIVALVTPIISFLFGWFLNKKKNSADVDKTNAEADKINSEVTAQDIANISRVAKIWEDLAIRFQSDVQRLSLKCDTLTEEVRLLRNENFELKSELHEYNRNNHNNQ